MYHSRSIYRENTGSQSKGFGSESPASRPTGWALPRPLSRSHRPTTRRGESAVSGGRAGARPATGGDGGGGARTDGAADGLAAGGGAAGALGTLGHR